MLLDNPLKTRISIELEGNISEDDFEPFYKELRRKLNIKIDKDMAFCYGLYVNENDLVCLEDSNKNKEVNILKDDFSIFAGTSHFIPTELLIQKYNIFDKKTKKTVKKACKIYDKYQTKIDPLEGIHVHLDGRSFFTSVVEIYERNQDLYDLNDVTRKKFNENMLRYNVEKIKEISEDVNRGVYRKEDSLNLGPLYIDGSVEFRILNSDKTGRKKLLKFLKSAKKTYLEGLKEYNIICCDKCDIKNYVDSVKYPVMTNDVDLFYKVLESKKKDNVYRSFEEFREKHKKGENFVVIGEWFSLPFDQYDKIL